MAKVLTTPDGRHLAHRAGIVVGDVEVALSVEGQGRGETVDTVANALTLPCGVTL